MVQGFSDEARASLSACYTPAELTSLERLLATPTAGLHIRCNELQSSREELLDELRRQPQLQGFRVEPHPILRDVAFVPRKPRAAALAPYLALDADARLRGPQRFVERKRRGLPPHEVFLDRVCAEAVLKGADAFVRGLRGASYGVDAGDVVTVYADVHEQLLRGGACETLGAGVVLIGVGECRMPRAALFREWSGLGVRMRHTVAGDLPALSGVLEDRVYVQSLPSLTAAHVLDARRRRRQALPPGRCRLHCTATAPPPHHLRTTATVPATATASSSAPPPLSLPLPPPPPHNLIRGFPPTSPGRARRC